MCLCAYLDDLHAYQLVKEINWSYHSICIHILYIINIIPFVSLFVCLDDWDDLTPCHEDEYWNIIYQSTHQAVEAKLVISDKSVRLGGKK